MNLSIRRFVTGMNTNRLMDQISSWRGGQDGSWMDRLGGTRWNVAAASLTQAPDQVNRWLGSVIPETKFYIIRMLAADQAMMERMKEMVEKTGPGRSGFMANRMAQRGMNWLPAAALGAGAMFFFDPRQGNRRRALLRDQVVHLWNKTGNTVGGTTNDLGNRARGMMSMGRSMGQQKPLTDEKLVARARELLGRMVSHPAAVTIMANAGRLTLSGPILADEEDPLLMRLSALRGVMGIDNQLEVHETPGDVPGLQGEPQRHRPTSDLFGWTPGVGLLAVVAGGMLAVGGVSLARRNSFSFDQVSLDQMPWLKTALKLA